MAEAAGDQEDSLAGSWVYLQEDEKIREPYPKQKRTLQRAWDFLSSSLPVPSDAFSVITNISPKANNYGIKIQSFWSPKSFSQSVSVDGKRQGKEAGCCLMYGLIRSPSLSQFPKAFPTLENVTCVFRPGPQPAWVGCAHGAIRNASRFLGLDLDLDLVLYCESLMRLMAVLCTL